MGLFDFFKRKPRDTEADLDEPRCHHYTLAHYVLRTAAFDDPAAFLTAFSSPFGPKLLDVLFKAASEPCAQKGATADFTAKDLIVHKVRVGKFPCAVIEMPRARAVAEAHFVAAVVMIDIEKGMPDPLPDPKDISMRYFTLEKGMTGFTPGSPPRTVLCEWTKDESHNNFGDGPPATVREFVKAMEKLMTTQ